jgi:hypothetical protein
MLDKYGMVPTEIQYSSVPVPREIQYVTESVEFRIRLKPKPTKHF